LAEAPEAEVLVEVEALAAAADLAAASEVEVSLVVDQVEAGNP